MSEITKKELLENGGIFIRLCRIESGIYGFALFVYDDSKNCDFDKEIINFSFRSSNTVDTLEKLIYASESILKKIVSRRTDLEYRKNIAIKNDLKKIIQELEIIID